MLQKQLAKRKICVNKSKTAPITFTGLKRVFQFVSKRPNSEIEYSEIFCALLRQQTYLKKNA